MMIQVSGHSIWSTAICPNSDDHVVVASSDHRIRALDLRSGRDLWLRRLPHVTKVAFSGHRLVATTSTGRVAGLDPTSGRRLFLTEGGGLIQYLCAPVGSDVVLLGRRDGSVEVRRASDGTLIRAVQLDARVSGLLAQGSRVVASTVTGSLWALDLLLKTKTCLMELEPGSSVLAANDELILAGGPHVLWYLGWTRAGLRSLEYKPGLRACFGLALPQARWAICTWKSGGGPASLGVVDSKGEWVARCRDHPRLSIFALARSKGRILAGAATGQLVVWKPRLEPRLA